MKYDILQCLQTVCVVIQPFLGAVEKLLWVIPDKMMSGQQK